MDHETVLRTEIEKMGRPVLGKTGGIIACRLFFRFA